MDQTKTSGAPAAKSAPTACPSKEPRILKAEPKNDPDAAQVHHIVPRKDQRNCPWGTNSNKNARGAVWVEGGGRRAQTRNGEGPFLAVPALSACFDANDPPKRRQVCPERAGNQELGSAAADVCRSTAGDLPLLRRGGATGRGPAGARGARDGDAAGARACDVRRRAGAADARAAPLSVPWLPRGARGGSARSATRPVVQWTGDRRGARGLRARRDERDGAYGHEPVARGGAHHHATCRGAPRTSPAPKRRISERCATSSGAPALETSA